MQVRIYNPTDPDLPQVARRVLAIMTNETGYAHYKRARAELKARRDQAKLDLRIEAKQDEKIISYAR